MALLSKEEKVDLFQTFIAVMKGLGFNPEYIGEYLALVIHALHQAEVEHESKRKG